ncbi:MAG: tetratricopeptide repeat protein [Proteobacteria bacterium]|nr:tetratricopeptide repeat protein [Pseudomonadota bacterium]MBI3498803.1 tetratricopeptide repeat protein [Pseudomonadota bacterium]
MVPPSVTSIMQRGLDEHRAGRLAQAESCYREALAGDPDNPDALHLLGVIELDRGNIEAALGLIGRAVERDDRRGEFRVNLANALQAAGRRADALVQYRRAIQLMPLSPEARNNMGAALLAGGDFTQAVASLKSAIAIRRDYGEAHYNLGTALGNLDRYQAALAEFRIALALLPAHAGAWTNLGFACHNLGDAPTAVACIGRAVRLRPDHPGTRTNLISAMRLVDGIGPGEELAECTEFGRRFGAPLAGALPELGRDRNPDRRLRVGYVAADGFRLHTASVSILPLMEAQERQGFELFCYSDVTTAKEDGVTARYRACASEYRMTAGLDDHALAERIRGDAIDVLVDVIGYPSGSRLLALARRPAPVQVNLLLMGSFGLPAVGWAISDEILTPAGSERWFVERLYRLPFGFCYDPLVPTPAVAPAPSTGGAGIVFGSMNQPAKLSPSTIAAWSEILRRVPDARLLLRGRAYGDPAIAERLRGVFEQHGVQRQRLELRGWAAGGNHLSVYGEIDIALDPFPYGGVITTCEALWSGVPVVSLIGNRVLGRYGLLFLSAVGERSLAAQNVGEYVARAVELSQDVGRLSALRASLRPRMQGSPLCDRVGYARSIEDGYRAMWRTWCGQ